MTTLSILLSAQAYALTAAVLPRCAIILTFSSGMMVLFCYCAMISNHEKTQRKTNSKIILITAILAAYCLRLSEQNNLRNTIKIVNTPQAAFIIPVAILVVILAIISINKALAVSNKSLTQSY